MSEQRDVLVVDDEEFVCDVYGRILDIDRHSYELCTSGEEAVRLMEAGRRYGIAVIDVVMPGMDGVETARRLHAMDPCMSIAFVTGTLGIEGADRLEFGVDMLFKPFTPKDLRRLIRKLQQRVRAA